MDSRVFQKNTFFEFEVEIFFSVQKCHKKFEKKISANLEVIWPPRWRVIFYIGNWRKIQRKFQKNRKFAISSLFLTQICSQIDFWQVMICSNHSLKHFTQVHVFWHISGGSKWPKLPILGIFGQFGTSKKRKTT